MMTIQTLTNHYSSKHTRKKRYLERPDLYLGRGAFQIFETDHMRVSMNKSYVVSFQFWSLNYRIFLFEESFIVYTKTFTTQKQAIKYGEAYIWKS